ncbi:glycosyltransferase [Palleronia sp.]|uniref:glycosyltransferase n=1 Tax=Palleronia sp. TaxID=1940284 RepID=UPI0035C861BD
MTISASMEKFLVWATGSRASHLRLRLEEEARRLHEEQARLQEEAALAEEEEVRLAEPLYRPPPELHVREAKAREEEAQARHANERALSADHEAHAKVLARIQGTLTRRLSWGLPLFGRGIRARRAAQDARKTSQKIRRDQLLGRQQQQRARHEKRCQQAERRQWRETRDRLTRAAREIRKTGDIEKTRAAWDRLRRHDPASHTARIGEIMLLRQSGQFEAIEEAVSTYAAEILHHPQHHLKLARVAEAGKLLDLATAHTQQALASSPRDREALRWAARFFTKHGLARCACQLFERGLGEGEIRTALSKDELAEFEQQWNRLQEALRLVGWDLATQGLPPETMRLADEAIRTLCSAPGSSAAYTPVPGRVLHVLPSFGPGGVQRQTLNLVRHLPEQSELLERFVMLPLKGDASLDFYRMAFEEAGAAIAEVMPAEGPLLPPDTSLSPEQLLLLHQLPERSIREIGHILAQIRHWRPEIVHAWSDPVNISAGLAAALAGTPRMVLGARSSAPTGRRAATSALFTHAAYQALLSRPGALLTTNSQAAAREFETWLERKRESVVTVYNGLHLDGMIPPDLHSRAGQLRQELGIPPQAAVVGAAFRFNAEKRPFLWVEAAAHVIAQRPETHFVLLGDGMLRPAVHRWVAERGLETKIHLPGLSDEVASWIAAFDAVFLTSRYEGTANIALEAQALGCPVVMPDVGGLAETFLPGETGLLTPADPAPEECADRLLACLNQAHYKEAARFHGEAFIRSRFGIGAYVEGYMACYGWHPVCPERANSVEEGLRREA